jgi:hypothetical protein
VPHYRRPTHQPRAKWEARDVWVVIGVSAAGGVNDFPNRHNHRLGLWQNHIERILAGWVDALGVPIYRGREVAGFAQDDTGRRTLRCLTASRCGRTTSSDAMEAQPDP